MYYLTVYNEPMRQPAEPDGVDVEGIVRGIHRISTGADTGPKVQLLGSGVSVPWAQEAAMILGTGVGGQRRRLVGDVLDRAAPGRPGRARSTTSCIPTTSRVRRT